MRVPTYNTILFQEPKPETIDVIQALTEIANITVAVNKIQNRLADTETKLQLAKSAIKTVIRELEELDTVEDWIVEYLNGVLEDLK